MDQEESISTDLPRVLFDDETGGGITPKMKKALTLEPPNCLKGKTLKAHTHMRPHETVCPIF